MALHFKSPSDDRGASRSSAYGTIRMLQQHVMYEHSTMLVVACAPNPGEIGLADARDAVRLGEAVWIGEPPPEVLRPPRQSAESLSSPAAILPGELTEPVPPDLGDRLAAALARMESRR
jgi:hypothetical protein